MTDPVHERVMGGFADALRDQDWDRLTEAFHDDAVLEFPQSRERFRGIANIRAQFENYPALDPGGSELNEIIGGTVYALTPSYTVIGIDGSGGKGTAVVRVHYPDDTWWWALNLYEVVDGRIKRSRTFFAQDFDAPDWRAPYREGS